MPAVSHFKTNAPASVSRGHQKSPAHEALVRPPRLSSPNNSNAAAAVAAEDGEGRVFLKRGQGKERLSRASQSAQQAVNRLRAREVEAAAAMSPPPPMSRKAPNAGASNFENRLSARSGGSDLISGGRRTTNSGGSPPTALYSSSMVAKTSRSSTGTWAKDVHSMGMQTLHGSMFTVREDDVSDVSTWAQPSSRSNMASRKGLKQKRPEPRTGAPLQRGVGGKGRSNSGLSLAAASSPTPAWALAALMEELGDSDEDDEEDDNDNDDSNSDAKGAAEHRSNSNDAHPDNKRNIEEAQPPRHLHRRAKSRGGGSSFSLQGGETINAVTTATGVAYIGEKFVGHEVSCHLLSRLGSECFPCLS